MMKKTILLLSAVLALAACAPKEQEQKVMARAVPERADDFVWENDLVCYRAYGEALEAETLSPGFDVWVKMPGKLVADSWYAAAQEDPEYYHHNHGEGKDCYKVGVSLGAGASAALAGGKFLFPATNWRNCEVLEQSGSEVVFVLNYPEWEAEGMTLALSKKITVTEGTRFCKCEDCWTFSGESEELTVCAGTVRHDIADEWAGADRFAIWEPASDQSKEAEEGMIGLAVYMPGAELVTVNEASDHSVCCKTVRSGETLTYWFGSCWSGAGEITESAEWFEKVRQL